MHFIEKNNDIVIWGAGNIGAQVVKKYSRYYNIKYIVDNKVEINRQEDFLGVPVYDPTVLKDRKSWNILVLCLINWHELKEQLDSYKLKMIRDFIPWEFLDYDCIKLDFLTFFDSDDEKMHYLKILAKSKQICGLYGMCHMSIYKHFLRKSKEFLDEYVMLDIPNINDIEDKCHSILQQEFLWNCCDLLLANLIYPSISNLYNAPNTKQLLKQLRKECKVILIPDVAFRGYFPQHTIGNKKTNKYFAWGDKNINKMIKQNISCENIVRKILYEEFYDYDFVNEYFDKAIEILQKDEKECDVKISDYIKENGKQRVLFYSWTHPNEEVMLEIGKRIFNILNLNGDFLEKLSDDIILNTNEELVYPCVLNGLGIENADVFMSERRMNPSHLWKENLLTCNEYIKEYVSINSNLE